MVNEQPRTAGEHQDSNYGTRNIYRYDELGNGHIRMIDLWPAKDINDPLICDLTQVRLGSHGKYTALSYSWAMDDTGGDNLSQTITIQGKPLCITQNLRDCLRRVRSATTTTRLWADAICIDQSNQDERTAQVAMMATIYQTASRTVLWLGEGSSEEDDLEVFHLLGRMQKVRGVYDRFALIQAWLHSGDGSVCQYERGDPCPCGGFYTTVRSTTSLILDSEPGKQALQSAFAESPQLIQLGIRRLQIIREFLGRCYWTRRWVIQEIQRSRNTCVQWRHFSLDSSSAGGFDQIANTIERAAGHFHRAMHDLKYATKETVCQPKFSTTNELGRAIKDSARKIESLFKPIKTHLAEPDLRLLLKLFDVSKCADPRDRLYSLLNLVDYCPLKPDYRLRTEDVFLEFAKYMLREHHGDWLLANLYHPNFFDDDVQRNMPSWVPDLREPFISRRYSLLPFGPHHAPMAPLITHSDSTLTLLVWYMGFVGSDIDRDRDNFTLVQGSFKAGKRRANATTIPLNLMRGDALIYGGDPVETGTRLMMPNDILCSCTQDPLTDLESYRNDRGLPGRLEKLFLLLRRRDRRPDTYRIVHCIDGSKLQPAFRTRERSRKVGSLRSMTVRIV